MNIKDHNIQVMSLNNIRELIHIYRQNNRGEYPTHILMHVEQYVKVRDEFRRNYYYTGREENPNKLKYENVLICASYELDEGEVLTGKMS